MDRGERTLRVINHSHPAPHAGIRIKSAARPNTLGLSQRDLVDLLEKLDASSKGAVHPKRAFTRWPFRHATVRVLLTQPSGTENALDLACRNLSRGGCSLLHCAFVHRGSQVVVALPRPGGSHAETAGVVRRCQHRRGVIHEIGVQFDEEVDVHEFLAQGQENDHFSHECVDPQRLQGVVLYAGARELEFRILQHFLRDTRMSIRQAKTAAEAATQAQGDITVIVCAWNLADAPGPELVRRLRRGHCAVPVILLAEQPGEANAARSLPDTTVLIPPLIQRTLLRAIAEHHLAVPHPPGVDARASIHADARAHFQMIADSLEQAPPMQNDAALREVCAQVRGAAISLGLTRIARCAEAVAGALSSSDSEHTGDAVRSLIGACRLIAQAA
ncbi:MAG: PilZ domain-containing protein [Phycisphaerales bacterium]